MTEQEALPAEGVDGSDPSLDRLCRVAGKMNDLRAKIWLANEYLVKEGFSAGAEDVLLAREELKRDLEKSAGEASDLVPTVDKLVQKFRNEASLIESRRRLRDGLAKVEEMAGSGTGPAQVRGGEEKTSARIRSMVTALGDLETDVTLKRDVLTCPRCNSHEISYKIQLTESGFHLYSCRKCSNAWRIVRFSRQAG